MRIPQIRNLWRLWFSDRTTIYNKIGMENPIKPYFARRYLENHGVMKYLVSGDKNEYGVSPHKMVDLVYLHKTIRRVRPSVVVELGCGFSSIVMAHALSMNNKGMLYIVDANKHWMDNLRPKLQSFDRRTELILSTASLQNINMQICHTFDTLPNVRPDMMYVDGCDPTDVYGAVKDLSMWGLKFAVSADALLYEWSFYPGFVMIVDGRYTNVEFLKSNLRRKYKIRTNHLENRTVFELIK